jgi:hypothetical protein
VRGESRVFREGEVRARERGEVKGGEGREIEGGELLRMGEKFRGGRGNG